MEISPLRIAIVFWLMCLAFYTAYAHNEAFKEQVAAVLGSEDSNALVELSGKTIYGNGSIRQMYQAREIEPIWNDTAIAAQDGPIQLRQRDMNNKR